MTGRRRRRDLAIQIVTLAITAIALVLLVRHARSADWPQVWQALAGYRLHELASAAALAALSYLLYCSYELGARHYAGHGLSTRRKGQFFALDPATGKTLWMTEGRDAGNAHLVVAGANLVAQLDNGEMVVAPVSKAGFKPERRYPVGKSATYTHPVLTSGGVLVRDQTHLRFWSW